MSQLLFTNKQDIYPASKLNAVDFEAESYLEVTPDIAFNPVKTVLKALGNIAYGDLLWLMNNIRDPFKELTVGRILKVPALRQASSVAIQSAAKPQQTVKVKQAKVDGQTITY